MEKLVLVPYVKYQRMLDMSHKKPISSVSQLPVTTFGFFFLLPLFVIVVLGVNIYEGSRSHTRFAEWLVGVRWYGGGGTEWEQDSSPTRQFTDMYFEDSSPTELKTVHRHMSRKYNWLLSRIMLSYDLIR